MIDSISVAVDNSEHSNSAIRLAIALGRAFGSRMIGTHVYAAKLHDVRFKQMEFTLPDEYKDESELEKQRRIHDALIARGLSLISDSYLDVMQHECAAAGLEFIPKTFDGRTFEALVEDINACNYGLVVFGALGQGAVRQSRTGSVVERVLRRVETDILVVRREGAHVLAGTEPILVAFDGSRGSDEALSMALRVASLAGRSIEVLLVGDGSEASEETLSDLAGRVRRGLREAGVPGRVVTVEGEPSFEILRYEHERRPWLTFIGRQGADAAPGDSEVGWTTERVVRGAAGDVWIVCGRRAVPTERAVTRPAVQEPA